jgi:hypothetical protein
VGAFVGGFVGLVVGPLVVGLEVGVCPVGGLVGAWVGWRVGAFVGGFVGLLVGPLVVGLEVGVCPVGGLVGGRVGWRVGAFVGGFVRGDSTTNCKNLVWGLETEESNDDNCGESTSTKSLLSVETSASSRSTSSVDISNSGWRAL